MSVSRWLLIEDDVVVNAVLWDGDTATWSPPAKAKTVLDPGGVGLGAQYDPKTQSFTSPSPPAPVIPESVTNFQGRYVMRTLPMPDGRSLFTTVDADLRAAVEATRALPEFDPARVSADLNWQAWEQANDYVLGGAVTQMLAARYGFTPERTADLFRTASTITV